MSTSETPDNKQVVSDRREKFKHVAMELSWSANAYLDCAERLCKNVIEDDVFRSPHHCRVVLHLAFQALELWFKAGLAAVQHAYPPSHDLDELRKLYNLAIPDLPLPIPSYIDDLVPRSRDLFADAPSPGLEQHFLRLRYASDRRGRLYPELGMIDLNILKKELELLSWEAQKVQMKIWFRCGWLKLEDDDEGHLERIYRRPFPPSVE